MSAAPSSGPASSPGTGPGDDAGPSALPAPRLQVALFVTCLVDLYRPSVGMSCVDLLERNGCMVDVPRAQTCCGQPAYNQGDRKTAVGIARQVFAAFERYDFVVVPSGSCAGMIKHHYATLFDDEPSWAVRAHQLARRTYELVTFLTDVLKLETTDSTFVGSVTYHDSCSSLRELQIKEQPRKLLDAMPGVDRREMLNTETCCGFGGTFCVKYPDISDRMVTNKAQAAIDTGAHTLLAGDMGCLLNIAGKLKRMGSKVEVRHVAEVLAGKPETAAIGEPKSAAPRRS